jgi:hypothetical protein
MFIQAYFSGGRTATLVRGDYLPRNPYGAISAAVDSIQQVLRNTFNKYGQLTTQNGDVRIFGHICYNDWNPFHPNPIVRIKNNVTHLFETLKKDVDYSYSPGQAVDIGDGKGNWWCKNNGNPGAGYEIRIVPGKYLIDPKDPKKPNLNYAGAPVSITFSGNNNGLPVGAGGQIMMYLPTTDRF